MIFTTFNCFHFQDNIQESFYMSGTTTPPLPRILLPEAKCCSLCPQSDQLGECGIKYCCKIWGFHGGDYEEWCLLGCYAVSEEPGASFIRVTRIGELGTQAATSNRSTLRRNNFFLSPWWRRHQVPPKRRFLQEPHGITSQKTPF
jgi:hypothetical protein